MDKCACICHENCVIYNKFYTRVFKLEEYIREHTIRLKELEGEHKKSEWQIEIENRIKEVEKSLENYREYRTSIEDLETDVMYMQQRIEKLERFIPDMQQDLERSSSCKKPHECPVCKGNGKIQTNESLTIVGSFSYVEIDVLGRQFKRCHACEGKGIVWG